MANPDHVERIKAGVSQWNSWRSGHSGVIVDLSGASLIGADLGGANLGWTHFLSADYFDVDDAGHPVRTAEIGVDLSGADLTAANLSGADLSQADLRHANLNGADLGSAELHSARFNRTILTSVDLSGTNGLDTTIHFGPSSVGIDTIYKSAGKIPESFLRGVGVPENFIAYIKSLVQNPIEFYSCFISYSFADQKFAERLYIDLQNKGVRCWFAPHNIAGGKKIHEQIDEAIRGYDRLLLILSENSMRSAWVETEISKARKRELREQRRMLFPVRMVGFQALQDWECFDADTAKDSAREIREYFIPDFSNWKDHDSYSRAFERLLRDLKADDAKAQKA
jgi:hypothetical protein